MSNTLDTRLTHLKDKSVWRAIAASWMALKTWVKIWLFWINFVFIGAFFFLDEPLGRWALLAYVASGPLLLIFMVAQRGLTRLLGLAHLIPWVPLEIYLFVRLLTTWAGPQITLETPALFSYTIVLLITVDACLSFDIYDLYRYIKGERFVMGSPAAVAAGASQPAH